MTDRTALSLAASPDLATLRAELDRALDEIEKDRLPVDQLGPELVRLGVGVSLPFTGLPETMMALHGLLHQLANAFPEDWQIAKARMRCRGQA
ncbi:hypothetical protein ACLB6G_05720 [Zhengella sp. ZM62]|uniref:hypothetical protein n=1 Tax=Zhengella sedimenti TaxID=3390035 RepID=UPI003974CF70